MKTSVQLAKEVTEKILKSATPRKAIKLSVSNIIFGRLLVDIPLFGEMLELDVDTNEYPDGYKYNKKKHHLLFRIYDGHLYREGLLDTYTWGTDKLAKCTRKEPIGLKTVQGIRNFYRVLQSIHVPEEQDQLIEFFTLLPWELTLVLDDEESREFIPVTTELLAEIGFQEVPNSYSIEQAIEEGSDVEYSPVKPGDALILEDKPFGTAVYVVEKSIFEKTYRVI